MSDYWSAPSDASYSSYGHDGQPDEEPTFEVDDEYVRSYLLALRLSSHSFIDPQRVLSVGVPLPTHYFPLHIVYTYFNPIYPFRFQI